MAHLFLVSPGLDPAILSERCRHEPEDVENVWKIDAPWNRFTYTVLQNSSPALRAADVITWRFGKRIFHLWCPAVIKIYAG